MIFPRRARCAVPHLPDRHPGGAAHRTRGAAVRPARLDARRDRRVDDRRAAAGGRPISVIVLGLSLCAGCGMLSQATSTGYVTASAPEGRSSAIGLYVSSFYIGGSVGGLWRASPGAMPAGRPWSRSAPPCWRGWRSLSVWCGHRGRCRNERGCHERNVSTLMTLHDAQPGLTILGFYHLWSDRSPAGRMRCPPSIPADLKSTW